LGWIHEYDGCAVYYFATSIYPAKRIAAMKKYDIMLSLFLDNHFGEKDAENFGGLRIETRF